MDWLKDLLKAQGLTEAQINAIVEGVENHYKGWVPKARFDEVNEARKAAEAALQERDRQLAELKKAAGDSEALKKQIEELQEANKKATQEYEAKLNELRIATAVKLAVAGDAHDPDIVLHLLDRSKIVLNEDGSIKAGLDEQLKTLRETKPFLFKQQEGSGLQIKGAKPADGSEKNPGGAGMKNPWSKEHFNLTEQGRIMRENPELAKQLMAAAKQ
ncbi:MAG: phage scaffolding protein [Limnochordales bacterium]